MLHVPGGASVGAQAPSQLVLTSADGWSSTPSFTVHQVPVERGGPRQVVVATLSADEFLSLVAAEEVSWRFGDRSAPLSSRRRKALREFGERIREVGER